jgi:hypothetical protein
MSGGWQDDAKVEDDGGREMSGGWQDDAKMEGDVEATRSREMTQGGADRKAGNRTAGRRAEGNAGTYARA